MKLSQKNNHGFAYVLALLLLAIFSTLAVAFASTTDLNLRKSENCCNVNKARLAAEGGMAFMNYLLRDSSVPSGATGQELLDAVAGTLSGKLDGTGNLQSASINYNNTIISVPGISTGGGQAFSAKLYLADSQTVHLVVTGSEGSTERTIGMDYRVNGSESAVFDYGIASKGTIRIVGNARIQGANSSEEASVLSSTYSNNEALKMTGNAKIDGDVYLSNPDAYTTLTGNISIGGTRLRGGCCHGGGGDIDEHIHMGIGDVEFPEVDTSVFESFATNVIDGNTNTSGNKTFNNVRIMAGTNPTFSGNIKLNGVVFIEQPNQVRFTGNLTVKGVIVTQDAGDEVYTQNTIKFTGNTHVQGVESLPDTSEFHDLREMPGSFLLSPGFGVNFTGNFGTIGGTMAADKFTFTGNAGGTIKGSILNYGDTEFKLSGNSNITIDRADSPEMPPGFGTSGTLSAVPNSYKEY